jgi:hypothetical protein
MKTWTCIVTTAPRSICTLKLTCESLVDCGWTPIIFAEPGSTDLSSTYETHWNTQRLGIWRNWLQASAWALAQNTSHVITVQDDVDFHPETKDWLDILDWPSNTGFISPYTPRPYQTWKNGSPRPVGLNPVKMRSCWTGQSLCFTHDVLTKLVNHPRAPLWCGLPPRHQRNPQGRIAHREFKQANPHLIQNSDYIIGSILQVDLGLTLYYPNPSLATHCNPVSSVNHGSNTGRRNSKYIAHFDRPIEQQLDPNRNSLI